jgi:hypothetical protein
MPRLKLLMPAERGGLGTQARPGTRNRRLLIGAA